jgi:hypothetical protein
VDNGASGGNGVAAGGKRGSLAASPLGDSSNDSPLPPRHPAIAKSRSLDRK